MRFDRIFPGIKTLVEDLAGRGELLLGAPKGVAVTGEEQSDMAAPDTTQARLTVRFLRSERLGRDEQRQIFDVGRSLYLNYVFGNRRLTLEISGECADQADDGMILPLLENVRTRLSSPSGLARVQALNCALASTSDIQAKPSVTYEDAGALSEASFTIELNVSVYYEDATNTIIETVKSTFTEPAQ
jgi:hypothetical protein